MNRRNFLKSAAAVSAAVAAGTKTLNAEKISGLFSYPDISAVKGKNYFSNTIKAVNLIGGMERFIKKDQHVAVLINSGFSRKGAFVNPDIPLAVVKMCRDAGAGKITFLKCVDEDYWERSSLFEQYKGIIEKCCSVETNRRGGDFNDRDWVTYKMPEGSALEELDIVRPFFDADVLINIPISKHHSTAGYTGVLKNTMGVCTRTSCRLFHTEGSVKNDPGFLGKCIAELNKLRRADLTVIDNTEYLTSGGPGGPGSMSSNDTVIAGTDIVAADAYAAEKAGFNPSEISNIYLSAELGLGEMNYSKLKIAEKEG